MISRTLWWASYFRSGFVRQLRVFMDALETRLMTPFKNIEQEANRVAQETWNGFGKSAYPEADPGDLAELAQEAGFQYYSDLKNLEQGLINVYASFCYHLFEQQLFYFHRKELLTSNEEDKHDLFNLKEVQRRLN